MLTCKIGENIVNCIDSKYDRYTFKQWSDKGILKCPVCNGDYEYCHGEIVSPYFRHKSKDCAGHYSESESEEHKQGKILLYNWLKNQEGIENLQLEAWIPETKQRPDVYFEQNGKRYVIEFQCTPIASEFIKRRELYKLNNINDIWILGTEKYSIAIKKDSIFHETRYRVIEKELDNQAALFYFYTDKSLFVTNGNCLEVRYGLFQSIKSDKYPYSFLSDNYPTLFERMCDYRDSFFLENINEFQFKDSFLQINNEIRNMYKKLERTIKPKWKEKIKKDAELKRLKEIKEQKIEDIKSLQYPLSNYLGTPGQEIIRKVTVMKNRSFYSRYGRQGFVYEFLDEENNLFVYFNDSLIDIDELEIVTIIASLSSHQTYRGVKQNLLENCKIKERFNEK